METQLPVAIFFILFGWRLAGRTNTRCNTCQGRPFLSGTKKLIWRSHQAIASRLHLFELITKQFSVCNSSTKSVFVQRQLDGALVFWQKRKEKKRKKKRKEKKRKEKRKEKKRKEKKRKEKKRKEKKRKEKKRKEKKRKEKKRKEKKRKEKKRKEKKRKEKKRKEKKRKEEKRECFKSRESRRERYHRFSLRTSSN